MRGIVLIGANEIEALRHTEYSSDVTVMAMLETLEKLWKVAQAADRLIYPPRTTYAAGSKKAALRDALLALEDKTEKV